MFDWDRDHGDLIMARACAPAPSAPARRWQWLPDSVGSAAVAVVLACALWLWPSASSDARLNPTLAAFGLPADMLTAPPATALPAGLIVYGAEEAERFRLGLSRFADRDLLVYADETRRMLADLTGPLAPFLADALLLAEAELTRRGLAPAPVPEALRQFRDARARA